MTQLIETLVVIFTTILIAALFLVGIVAETLFYTTYYVFKAVKKAMTKPCVDR